MAKQVIELTRTVQDGQIVFTNAEPITIDVHVPWWRRLSRRPAEVRYLRNIRLEL